MTIHIPDNLSDLRDAQAGGAQNKYVYDYGRVPADARAAANEVMNSMAALSGSSRAAGRDRLSASEQRDFDKAKALLEELRVIERDCTMLPAKFSDAATSSPTDSGEYRDGQPLRRDQSFAGFSRAMGHGEPEHLDFGRCIRGAVLGDWRGAEAEHRAMSGVTNAAGGFMVPTLVSSMIIDLARNQTRVLEAGATIVPMDNRSVVVPRWAADPTPAFRAENSAYANSDGVLDGVQLNAKGLGVVTQVSRELLEDTNIGDELMRAFASAFALKIDQVALYGSGTAPEPLGLKNSSVTKTPMAVNGASPTWGAMVASVGRLRDANETPNAQIVADRALRSLAGLTGSDGQYLAAPSYLDGIQRLSTNQVPTNLTVGSSSDSSDIFTGDWTKLLVGVRTELTITRLNERYLDSAGQIGFLGHWRGDIAIARVKAFDIVTGVRP